MALSQQSPKITGSAESKASPLIAILSADLLLRANDSASNAAFLTQVLPLVLEATGAEFASIAAVENGRWTSLAESGKPRRCRWR